MSHGPRPLDPADKQPLGTKAWPAYNVAFIAGVVGLIAALLLALLAGYDQAVRRLAFSYLTAYTLFLGITLGCLFFVIITHLFRAGWCAAIRRIPEAYAANMPVLAALALPLLLLVAVDGIGHGEPHLYAWTQAFDEHHGHDAGHGDEKHQGDEHHEPDAQPNDHADTGYSAGPITLGDPQATTPVIASWPGVAAANDPPHVPGTPADPDSAQPAYTPGSTLAQQQSYYEQMVGYFTNKKQPWLSWWFFGLRILLYLAIWSAIGLYYYKQSRKQDEVGRNNTQPTLRRESKAPWITILFALTITFGSFDLIMSLDPAFYSTIFGVYYFSGSFLAACCAVVLTLMGLQRFGYLKTVSVDHYHDLGKLMFAFVFFWGYIAFSQYMLIWYASLPETTYWFELRGVTTVTSLGPNDPSPTPPQAGSAWTWIAFGLLFGKLLFPFCFLLSAHVKRNLKALAFIAVWIIAMQYLDLYWLIMPMYERDATPPLPLVELLTIIGVGGIVVGGMLRKLRDAPLVAYGDPRLHESLALDTTAWAPIHHAPKD